LAELRKYPRLPFGEPGELAPEGGTVLPVVVRRLACEGAEVEVAATATLRHGGVVALRFRLPDGPVELSARVMWIAGGRAGLALRLSDTDPESKRLFGAWIVPRTKEALAARKHP
jgi:hypothetical protein